jgi:integrase/recombinase XerD
MADRNFRAISLFTPSGGRKYLNTAERNQFRRTCNTRPSEVRLFCSVLYCSGCRISEALALTSAAIDLDDRVATFQTLKRRRKGVMRQVPLPASLVGDLDRTFKLRDRQQDSIRSAERLWPWSRVTAWRRIKSIMVAANVTRSAAMPKGLRHSFGVIGFQCSVPPHTTLARPRIAEYNSELRRRDWRRRTGVCIVDMAKGKFHPTSHTEIIRPRFQSSVGSASLNFASSTHESCPNRSVSYLCASYDPHK